MATVAELADATIRIKSKSDKSVGWALAARKAVIAQGITNPSDVRRLAKAVVGELGSRSQKKRCPR